MSSDIESLVATINEHPDPLHGDRTPAVEALIQHGVASLPYVLPLLAGEHELTRLRAQRVLEGVTLAWVRERTPSHAMTRGDVREWQELWDANGSYDWRASPEARSESVGLWGDWVESRGE
jgi:hypothetical protein